MRGDQVELPTRFSDRAIEMTTPNVSPPALLTKSDLQSLHQCPRKLWLEHHRRDLIPHEDPSLWRRATDGNFVGAKARQALGADVLWPPAVEDPLAAFERARQLLHQHPGRPAVEVPLLHGDLHTRADALVPETDGYVLRETKAATFPLKKDKTTPDAPDEHHVRDVAIQVWAAQALGHPLVRAELNLLNNQWRYPGNGDYSGLFRTLDVTAAAQALAPFVPQWRDDARAVLAGAMPQARTGRQCEEPYACPFRGYCKPLDPPGEAHPITLLPDAAGKKLAKKLHQEKGYTSLLQAAPAELTGAQAALYRRIQHAHAQGAAVIEPGAGALLAALPYPRYFFDFEGIDLPVPHWSGVRPYEHVPFQWSCHIEGEPGVFEHAEFLDLTGDDPSLPCIERMREVIADDGGPIFVYYATYERKRLEELTVRHPEHAELLNGFIARLVDLLPVVKDHFYHPAMAGSFSIKKVLPVIAPDLRYDDLDEVQEGTGAQLAYLYAVFDPNTTAERKAQLDAALRRYCRQDTWAMVEVAHFLAGAGRPPRPEDL